MAEIDQLMDRQKEKGRGKEKSGEKGGGRDAINVITRGRVPYCLGSHRSAKVVLPTPDLSSFETWTNLPIATLPQR